MAYPKLLYKSGWEDTTDNICVANDKAEEAARADGYKDLPRLDENNEPIAEKPVVEVKAKKKAKK